MALPVPEAGLVISYSYLWRHEKEIGIAEGKKDRPCAIILVAHKSDGATVVTVAPITHSAPSNPSTAMEIPPRVKRHLGLDGERSWVVLDDFNEFIWPGFDIRPVPGRSGRYEYGLIPPAFYTMLVNRTLELRKMGLVFKPSSRD